jgi:hypothetical protein
MRIIPKSKKARITVGLLVAAGVASGGGAAYAYWSTTGSGTGTVAASTTTPVTVVQTSTISNLAPGVAAQTLSGNFTNGNSGPVYVTSVTASITSVNKAVGAPAGTCDATDYTLSNATMTINAEVPAGAAQGAWTGATIAFNDKPSVNQDACKNATVNLAYSVS